MKRIVSVIMLCVFPFYGCSNNVEKPGNEKRVTVATRTGPVTMTEVKRNVDRKELSAHVEGTQVNATLRIVPAGDGVVTTGGTAMLIDASGKLLYSLEMTLNSETNEVTYRQATEDDYLTVSIRNQDDRVHESYDTDGDQASFDYPLLPYDSQRRVANQLEHNLPTDQLPGDMREYAMEADAFQTYYMPHANNSLNNNDAARLLMQLLSAPEAPQLLLGDQPDPQMNKLIQAFCHFASGCATFVCTLFPLSGLCIACAGAAIACQIFQIIGTWTGWGDD
jgi:hypothetical protein